MKEARTGKWTYTILMLVSYMLLAFTIGYTIYISNNFDVNKHHNILIRKLISHPELSEYRSHQTLYGFKKIEKGTASGNQLPEEYIGYYIIRIKDAYIIYDFNKDRIVHIYR